MAEEAPARENGPGSGPPPEATDQVLPGEVVSSEPGETSGRTIPLKEVSPPSVRSQRSTCETLFSHLTWQPQTVGRTL
eukprot:6211163-Pyramimonas_sp.AAC.1